MLGEANPSKLCDAFQPRGDIHALAHQVAVALLDDVADMDADGELYPLILRHARISFDQAVLHFNRAPGRVDYAAELDDAAIAGALDDAAMMHGDGRVDQVAAQRPEPGEDAIYVCARKPGVADDVGDQDRGQFPSLAHGATAEAGRWPVVVAWAWLHFHAALITRGGRECRPGFR
jgi:hypothetical protein